jgi:hypothetical protein
LDVRDLWQICRDQEGGLRHLPFGGGAAEQPAWLMEAFELLEAQFQKVRPRRET